MYDSFKPIVVVIGMLGFAPALALAQQSDAVSVEPDAPSMAIVITDGPLAVDPATLVAAAVAENASVEFLDTSLSDVAAWLQKTAGLHVILDRRSLEAANILTNESVVDRLQDEPIYLLLDRLANIGIGWRLTDGILRLDAVDDEFVFTKQYKRRAKGTEHFSGSC